MHRLQAVTDPSKAIRNACTLLEEYLPAKMPITHATATARIIAPCDGPPLKDARGCMAITFGILAVESGYYPQHRTGEIVTCFLGVFHTQHGDHEYMISMARLLINLPGTCLVFNEMIETREITRGVTKGLASGGLVRQRQCR